MDPQRPIVLYFAAALFTKAERQWNAALAERLKARLPGLEIILPQDFEHEGMRTPQAIFRTCLAGVDRADLVLAILDGMEPDSGTCLEVGYAYGRGKPIIGVRTDFRKNQSKGLNVMLRHGCAHVVEFFSFNEDVDQLAGRVARSIKAVMRAGGGGARDCRGGRVPFCREAPNVVQ